MPPPNPVNSRTADRRDFLKTMATAVGIAAAGLTPSRAAAQAARARSLALGLDSFCIRGSRWKATRVLEYAASLGLDMVQITQGDFESFEEPYLQQIRELAARLGLQVEPGFGCFCPLARGWNRREGEPADYLRRCIRQTKVLGASCFKVFMASGADRTPDRPIAALIERSIAILRAVRAEAVDAGVKIAVENHGDLQSLELRDLIEQSGPDAVACCFDSGNAAMVAEDPVRAFDILAPHIVTSHVRDAAVYEHPRGAEVQWVALGDGSIDLPLLAARFPESCPGVALQLEILTGGRPRVLPLFESEFWRAFPGMPASELARFLALARRGRPFSGRMLLAPEGTPPPDVQQALAEQQRFDLERSLSYARQVLGAGSRNPAGA